MSIRKTNAPIAPKKLVSASAPALPKPVDAIIKELKSALTAAIAPGPGRSNWLSENEAKGLIARAQAGGPDVAARFAKDMANALTAGAFEGKPLTLGDAALQALAAFAGVAPGAVRTAQQSKDAAASHALAEGLTKAKEGVTSQDAAKTKGQLEELRLQGQTGAKVSAQEFSPQFKAAKAVSEELFRGLHAHMAENNPEAAAAFDAIAPRVQEMITSTGMQLAKDPEAMARLSGVLAKFGKEGFQEALKSAAPDVAKAFTEATGVAMVNEKAVKSGLEGLVKLAEKFAPEAAGSIAKAASNMAGKLGVELGSTVVKAGAEAVAKTAVKEGAEAVAKGAVKAGAQAVAKTAAKEGAEAVAKTAVKAGAEAVAKTAVKEGAEVAAKAGVKVAATGGKALPIVGNLISVGSACLAAVGLVKELFKNPRDGEKIAKEGLNTLLQTVGIAFPWAALAGDVIDMGWSAKTAVTDAKTGAAPSGISKQDAAPLAAEPARLLASALEGAGQGGIASSFRALADSIDKAAGTDEIGKRQMDAFGQLAQLTSSEVGKAAAQLTDPATKDALSTISHGLGEVFKVAHKHKKLGNETGLKRDETKAQLMKVLVDVGGAAASLFLGGKGTKLSAA